MLREMQWIRDRVQALRHKGKTLSGLARALGVDPARVTEMIKGTRRIQFDELQPMAAYLEVSVEELMSGRGLPGSTRIIDVELVANDAGREAKATYPESQISYPAIPAGPPDIPVWASAQAGDEGAIVLVPDPIDYIRRSERMLSVRNPFAFNVLGASMSPAIEHGNLVVINPSVPAKPGDDCVFIHEGADGMLALVKRFLRPGADHWRVRQFNEPKDFEISRRKWSRVHVIEEIRRR